MVAVLSDPVCDVVAAVEKLRADDRLITSPGTLLDDADALLEAITMVQAVVVRRLRAAHAVDASDELFGRSTKKWLHEDLLLPAPEASRLTRLMHQLPAHPATTPSSSPPSSRSSSARPSQRRTTRSAPAAA